LGVTGLGFTEPPPGEVGGAAGRVVPGTIPSESIRALAAASMLSSVYCRSRRSRAATVSRSVQYGFTWPAES
jgi:hypothetical protein